MQAGTHNGADIRFGQFLISPRRWTADGRVSRR